MSRQLDPPEEPQIDDDVVKHYFDGAGDAVPATLSMMAHEHNLPLSAAQYRVSKELRIIGPWLDNVSKFGRVLDVGCGAGTWVEIFANRFRFVVGVESRAIMVEAAINRVIDLPHAQILQGDGRRDLPSGPYELNFVGGLCMYMKDSDVVYLLRALRSRLSKGGSLILRESTAQKQTILATGGYQAVYRNVDRYQDLFEEAGFPYTEVRWNSGYNSMLIAEELVDFRRKWLRFLPRESQLLGYLTWAMLRIASPITFWMLPLVLSLLKVPWPRLQNHFFKLELPK